MNAQLEPKMEEKVWKTKIRIRVRATNRIK